MMWIGHFAVDFMIGIWPIYKTMMQMDLAVVGIITAIGVCLGEGMQLLFGALSDSGHRRVVLLGGLMTTLAAVLYPYASTILYLFPLFVLTCIGSGAFHPAASSVVNGLTKKRRGLYVTIFASGGMVGMAASQLIFSQTYNLFSGHTAILAIPTVLLVISLGFSSKFSSPVKPKSDGRPAFNFHAIREFFRRRELVMLYILQVANQSVFWALVFLLPDVLTTRGASTWIAFGGGHFALIMGCASMMVPGGYFADKYSPRHVLFVSTIVGVAGFYTFLFCPGMSELLMIGLLFVLGAALGVCNPVSVALGNHLMPDSPGVVSAALMGLVWVVAEGLGPGGSGILSKFFVDDAPAKALMILGTLFAVALYVIPKLPSAETEASVVIPN